MSTRFYFGDDSTLLSQSPAGDDYSHDNNDDDGLDDSASLPFPKPLSRPSFLSADFDPHTFLSGLSTSSNRFQTLEDLQTELRELSAAVNRELVDLVNENYEEFVSLGKGLRGGEEKVEEVRVGLLGLEKDVTGLRDRVLERREEVGTLMGKKREIRKEIGMARRLLEIDDRLEDLEIRLSMKDRGHKVANSADQAEIKAKWSQDWDEESLEESDEEFDEEDGVPGRVRALVRKYLILKTLVKSHDLNLPFLTAQNDRMQRVQDRIRLEVETAIRAADEVAVKQLLIEMKVRTEE